MKRPFFFVVHLSGGSSHCEIWSGNFLVEYKVCLNYNFFYKKKKYSLLGREQSIMCITLLIMPNGGETLKRL
jgi:hypothetical protein